MSGHPGKAALEEAIKITDGGDTEIRFKFRVSEVLSIVSYVSDLEARLEQSKTDLEVARRVHRWSTEKNGENLMVCRDEHEKGRPCEYETFVPIARLEKAKAERDYWKTESQGETAKVEYRDKLLATARNDALEDAMSELRNKTLLVSERAVATITMCISTIRALQAKP